MNGAVQQHRGIERLAQAAKFYARPPTSRTSITASNEANACTGAGRRSNISSLDLSNHEAPKMATVSNWPDLRAVPNSTAPYSSLEGQHSKPSQSSTTFEFWGSLPPDALSTDIYEWNPSMAGNPLTISERQGSLCNFVPDFKDGDMGFWKQHANHGIEPSWQLSLHTSGLHPTGTKYSRSETGTDLSSQSPSSLFSELSERDRSSHEASVGDSSQLTNWAGSLAAPSIMLAHDSSRGNSNNLFGLGQAQSRFRQGPAAMDISGLPYISTGQSIGHDQTSGSSHQYHTTLPAYMSNNVNLPSFSSTQYGAEDCTPDSSQWQPHTYSMDQPTSLVQGANYYDQDYETMLHLDPSSDLHSVREQSAESNAESLSRPFADPEFSGNADLDSAALAQRRKEDDILLEGKRVGLTYKEIKQKMRTKVAESTLRGRYRSLTKARKDRVRKPKWTNTDLLLLRKVVHQELGRLDNTYHEHASREQRLAKLSWKRIAEYIADNGGSYHFGNSTCKKKWAEIECEG